MDNQLQSLDQVKASILDMGIRFGPKLMVAIFILVAGYVAGRWAGGIMDRLLGRFDPIQLGCRCRQPYNRRQRNDEKDGRQQRDPG